MIESNNVFLVFEPGNHMGRVLRAAKNRGFHVITIHQNPISTLPPYGDDFKLTDEYLKVDFWQDTPALLALIQQTVGDRVIGGTYAGKEYTLALDAQIRADAGLPHNSPELIADLLNKRRVRERLQAAGLCGIKVYNRTELEQWTQWPVGFKGFFKPVFGGSSLLVRHCDSLEKLQAAQQMWQVKPEIETAVAFKNYVEQADNEYILEQEIEGELLSVEGFTHNGEYRLIGITGRQRLADDLSIEMAGLFPHKLASQEIEDKLVAKVKQIHQALGITYGPTHTEMIVQANGEAELVELNLRFAGADVLLLMNACFDTLVEELLCDFCCGNEIDYTAIEKTKYVGHMRYILPPQSMKVMGELQFPPETVFSRIMNVPGTTLPVIRTQNNFIGGMIIVAADGSEAMAKTARIIAGITVDGQPFDVDANNILESIAA